MSRSPMIRATCTLLAAEPEHGVNAVALAGLDDRTRSALGRSVANATNGAFRGGTLWLDLAGVTPRLTVIRQVERQLGIARSGDPDLARRVRRLHAALAARGRALFVLAEPTDAGLAQWVVSDLMQRGASALLLTGDPSLAERLSAAEPRQRGHAAGDEPAAGPDARFSYETLWPALQWRVRSLGAFAPGPVSALLAAQVWGDEAEAAGQALSDLCACALLEAGGTANEPALPAYVQEHAASLLAMSPETDLVRQRHAEAVLALIGEAEADYAPCGPQAGGPQGVFALDRYAENWAQISAAWRYLAARDDFRGRATADAFLGAAPRLMALVVPPALRAEWLGHALRPAATPGRGRWEARHLVALAHAQTELGRPEEAARTAQQALALAREMGDQAAIRGSQMALGIARRLSGDRGRAVEHLSQALAGTRAAGDLRGEDAALEELERAIADRPDIHVRATERRPINGANNGAANSSFTEHRSLPGLLRERVACARRLGDPYAELEALTHFARAEANVPSARCGPGAPAVEAYRQAVVLAQRVKDVYLEATLARELGDICLTAAPAEAVVHYAHALALSRQTRDRQAETEILCGLGRAYIETGQGDAAVGELEHALAHARAMGDERNVLCAQAGLSDALAAAGQPAAAALAAQQLLPLARRLGDVDAELAALLRVASAHLAVDDTVSAIEHLEASLTLARRSGQRPAELQVLLDLARSYLNNSILGPAMECLEGALALARDLGRADVELDALGQLAHLHLETGRDDLAAACFNAALPLSRATGDARAERDTLIGLATCERQVGQLNESVAHLREALALEEPENSRPAPAIHAAATNERDCGGCADHAGLASPAVVTRLDLLLRLADVERQAGRSEEAVRYANEALAASRERGDAQAELAALLQLGAACDAGGQGSAAAAAYTHALVLSRTLGEQGVEAPLLQRLGDDAVHREDDEIAAAYYRAALPLYQAACDHGAAGALYFELAEIDCRAGRFAGAVRHCEQALVAARVVGDHEAEAAVLRRMAAALAQVGDQEQAIRSLAQAIVPVRLAGDRSAELDIQLELAVGCEKTGKPMDALAAYRQAARLAEAEADLPTAIEANRSLGAVALANGRPAEGCTAFTAALALARQARERAPETRGLSARNAPDHGITSEFDLLVHLGEAQMATRRANAAVETFGEALALARDAGDVPAELDVLTRLGEACTAAGEPASAVAYYEQALPSARALGQPETEMTALLGMSAALAARGRVAGSAEAAEHASRAGAAQRTGGRRGRGPAAHGRGAGGARTSGPGRPGLPAGPAAPARGRRRGKDRGRVAAPWGSAGHARAWQQRRRRASRKRSNWRARHTTGGGKPSRWAGWRLPPKGAATSPGRSERTRSWSRRTARWPIRRR